MTNGIDTGVDIPEANVGGIGSVHSIRQAIAAAVADVIPEGKQGAVVGILQDDGTMHILLAEKLGDHFQISGDLSKDGKHISGRIMVGGSW